jgi:hypothetical protein
MSMCSNLVLGVDESGFGSAHQVPHGHHSAAAVPPEASRGACGGETLLGAREGSTSKTAPSSSTRRRQKTSASPSTTRMDDPRTTDAPEPRGRRVSGVGSHPSVSAGVPAPSMFVDVVSIAAQAFQHHRRDQTGELYLTHALDVAQALGPDARCPS